MDKPESVTLEADRIVAGDRNDSYGRPIDDFSRTAVMWSAILKTRVTAEQVAMCMIAVKLSRECNKPKRDNTVDVCGYAKCLDQVNVDRAQRLKDGWTFDEFTGVWTKPNPAFDLAKILRDSQPVDVAPVMPLDWDKTPVWPGSNLQPYIGDPLNPVIYTSEAKSNG